MQVTPRGEVRASFSEIQNQPSRSATLVFMHAGWYQTEKRGITGWVGRCSLEFGKVRGATFT
jgi:hypothetical protein